MDCRSKYKELRKVYRRYKKKDEKDEFVSYFTFLILSKAKATRDNETYNKIKNIYKGKLPRDVNVLVPELLSDVYDDLVSQCPKYSKKYAKLLGSVSLNLVRAYLGYSPPPKVRRSKSIFTESSLLQDNPAVVPDIVSRVADKIDTVVVPDQMAPSTAVTPQVMLDFIRQIREENVSLSPTTVLNSKDVKKIVDVMVDLTSAILHVDSEAVRDLTFTVLESAFTDNDEYQRALKKYSADVKKFAYSNSYQEPTLPNLKRLLVFYGKVFPKAKPLVERGGSVDVILSAVQSNPSLLEETYNYFKNLLLEVIFTTPHIEELSMSFVGAVEQVWKTMEASVLKDMSLPTATNPEQILRYMSHLADVLTKAKAQILDLVFNKCRDEHESKGWFSKKEIPKDCQFVRADAKRLDSIIEKLDKFVVANEFDDFRNKILGLTKVKILEKVEDALSSGKYTKLAAMANPIKDMKDEEFYSISSQAAAF